MDIYIGRLSRAFDNNVLTVRAENDGNTIGYALKLNKMPQGAELLGRASDLQVRHGINFPLMVSQMRASMRLDKMFV